MLTKRTVCVLFTLWTSWQFPSKISEELTVELSMYAAMTAGVDLFQTWQRVEDEAFDGFQGIIFSSVTVCCESLDAVTTDHFMDNCPLFG